MSKFIHFKKRLFYLLLLIGGIGLYVGWSALYGTWTDIGLYSICIVMILLGFLGTILYSKDREELNPEEME